MHICLPLKNEMPKQGSGMKFELARQKKSWLSPGFKGQPVLYVHHLVWPWRSWIRWRQVWVNLECPLKVENLPFYQISRQYHKSVMYHDSYPNFLYWKGFWKPHTFQKINNFSENKPSEALELVIKLWGIMNDDSHSHFFIIFIWFFQYVTKKDFEIFIILSMVVIFTLIILSRAIE